MQIEEYRVRLEQFHEALNREQYLHYSGQKELLETAGLYSEYSDLFRLETIHEIQAEIENLPATAESRRECLEKLRAFAVDQHLEQSCTALSDEIAEFESKRTVSWNGTEIFFNQISIYLANEADAGKRRRLNELRLKALKDSNSLRKERLANLHTEVRGLGYANYLEAYESVLGLEYQSLASSLEGLLKATENDFMARLAQSLQHALGLALSEVRRCDIGYWARMGEYDHFFRSEQMVPMLSATLEGLGIHLERQRAVSLDLENRPRKYPRAFCAPVRIPQEIKIVLLPHGGQEDYATLLHEAGHAQHFAWTNPTLLPEHRLCGDRGLSETYAFLFEHLIWSKGWLESLVKLVNPVDFLRSLALSRAHLVRRYCGKLRYEISLHTDRVPENPARYYAEILQECTGIRYDRESYLEDLDDGFYSADYLRAWIFEAQLRDYLRSKFGNAWFQCRAAGEFLKDIWQTGQLYGVEDLSREIGIGAVDPQALTDELQQGLGQ